MKENQSELDKLFENLPKDEEKEADVFGDKTVPEKDKEPEKAPESQDKDEELEREPYKNRRHRRLEQQLQEEREARIRAEALAETRVREVVRDEDIDPRWTQIYGDTPEAKLAWKLQQDILQDQFARTKEQTLQELKEEQLKSQQEQREYESYIDSELEAIEDDFNIDLTSDAPAARKVRREFLEMVQTLSPKDEDGELKEYADFQATWDLYRNTKLQENKPDASRNKEIAAKSMANNNGAPTPEREITPGFRGWQRDFNL